MESASRDGIVDYLHRQLIGPVDGVAETIKDPPTQRYLMGTLYPQGTEADVEQEGDIQDDQVGQIGDEIGDDPISLANTRMPSCLGLSFLLDGEPTVEVCVVAAGYTKADRAWQRRELAPPEGERVRLRARYGITLSVEVQAIVWWGGPKRRSARSEVC